MNENIQKAIALYQACVKYSAQYHKQRIEKLVKVLDKHPNARVESCSDEFTGQRFARAKCRRGHCSKIGRSTYKQYWAVWTD